MNQLGIKFSKNTIRNINIYREASKNESIGETGINVKFSPTQKQALINIMKEHNIAASTFLREAMDIYIEIFPFREKLKRHKEILRQLLSHLT